MISVFVPNSEEELALLRSVLESQGILVHVENDYLGSILSFSSNSLSARPKTIMVSENQQVKAVEIIKDFLSKTSSGENDEE